MGRKYKICKRDSDNNKLRPICYMVGSAGSTVRQFTFFFKFQAPHHKGTTVHILCNYLLSSNFALLTLLYFNKGLFLLIKIKYFKSLNIFFLNIISKSYSFTNIKLP